MSDSEKERKHTHTKVSFYTVYVNFWFQSHINTQTILLWEFAFQSMKWIFFMIVSFSCDLVYFNFLPSFLLLCGYFWHISNAFLISHIRNNWSFDNHWKRKSLKDSHLWPWIKHKIVNSNNKKHFSSYTEEIIIRLFLETNQYVWWCAPHSSKKK